MQRAIQTALLAAIRNLGLYYYNILYIICNLAAVLSSCIAKVARTGPGVWAGGLLLLAACTDCPLLLVQQAIN